MCHGTGEKRHLFMKSEETKHPHRGRFLKILLSVLILTAGCFLIWTADYYHADDTAKAVLAQGFQRKRHRCDSGDV